MANSMTGLGEHGGANPSSPTIVQGVTLGIDTYVTGGVEIQALLEANADWKASGLEADDIIAATPALVPDAAGAVRFAEYLPDSKKLVIKKAAAGPALAEESNGAIGATVNVHLTLFLA